jgi:hypothetical protein
MTEEHRAVLGLLKARCELYESMQVGDSRAALVRLIKAYKEAREILEKVWDKQDERLE